jgi:RND family efflux transporter MFP subunit
MAESHTSDLSNLKIQRSGSGEQPSAPHRRTGIYLYIAGGVFLSLSLFFFLRSALSSEPVVEIATVLRVSPGQANSILTASGYVVAQRKASIASKATGRLVYLGYREGDRVKKDQIIARIESTDVAAALTQAKADLDIAIADKNDAERTLARTKSLFDRQLASQADYDAAMATYDRVTATIASRTAGVQAAEVQVENTRIRAPFDGTIVEKNADVGEVVAPYSAGASSRVAVVTIADMSSLEVEADVSESNIERVLIGQSCEITLDAYPDKRYRGVVDKIVPTADRAKATVLTKIKFLEIDNKVLPEMSAKTLFLSKDAPVSTDTQNKIAVDPSAVATREGKKILFVVRDNIVTATPVETGISLGNYIELRVGPSPGEKVVLKPPDDLHTGMKVKVKE